MEGLDISLTGKEDWSTPWKYAICGHAGAGKTLLASTAPNPLFVFFRENPRYKSVVDRYIPHVKLVNKAAEDGSLEVSVLDQLELLYQHLKGEHEYETLVIDTGDEMFRAMKEARRIRNKGEWKLDDWGWLSDTYREVMTAFIDLPLRIVVLYHIKDVTVDDQIIRDLDLQGSSQAEAPGWFDVVGVLDTYEVVDEEGETVTKRVLLTHSSRLYPWVKDHSGRLPRRFEISDNFVGDWSRLENAIFSKDVVGEREQVEAIQPVQSVTPKGAQSIPTPAEVQKKKGLKQAIKEAAEAKQATAPKSAEVPEKEEKEEESQPVEDVGPIPSAEPSKVIADDSDGQEQGEGDALARAQETVQEILGAEEVSDEELEEVMAKESKPNPLACAVCGVEDIDENLRQVSMIKFRQVLCREHFKQKVRNNA